MIKLSFFSHSSTTKPKIYKKSTYTEPTPQFKRQNVKEQTSYLQSEHKKDYQNHKPLQDPKNKQHIDEALDITRKAKLNTEGVTVTDAETLYNDPNLGGLYCPTSATTGVTYVTKNGVKNLGTHAVLHELVHHAHAQRCVETDKFFIQGQKTFNGKGTKIASRVSTYAKTSPSEFVAETGAGLLSGQKYDKNVMSMYWAFRGPEMPGLGLTTPVKKHQLKEN